MAGNKINTKAKSKEDKCKANKGTIQPNEESEEHDFSLLRKPILTSITGFAQARKIFDIATEELKTLLSNECDILYECKVCRNIFRSLANFISHKRVYCKELFNTSVHGHFIKAPSTVSELMKIKRLEEDYQESIKNKKHYEDNVEEDDRIPLTKDLTAIVENIAKNRGVPDIAEGQHVVLDKIPNSNVAMFQSIQYDESKKEDTMKSQVKELNKIFSRDKAVFQSDGKFKIKSSVNLDKTQDADNVIQISDDDENGGGHVLKCKICDLQFSTQKTLKFHMKYKHLESRLVYPCPDCLEIFSTSWSVYRHLFKVHRKTAAQIRRLRESIQAKAFRMNNPPAYYEKKKNNMKSNTVPKITEEERLDQENQAWMDNMEGDGELPRCGGCGRTFERRAALAAHTYTCQPRSRALARRPQETKKIEIQIRKDYNKGPNAGLNLNVKTNSYENKTPTEDPQFANKTPKEIEKPQEEPNEKPAMEVDEDEQKSNDSSDSPEKLVQTPVEMYNPAINLPFAQHLEKNNHIVFKQKMLPDIELDQLLCKKCDSKCSSIPELYDHMADHYKWMRYACKLCNFKHYNFEKLPEHVKVVHKLKGDTDFYFSTVKAIDGNQALELCENSDEPNDVNDTSPESRRPSRCSSDSSRLSDDSSSSSTRFETVTRKRKLNQNKIVSKRKKEMVTNDDGEDPKDSVSLDNAITVDSESSTTKAFDDNSSDIDEIEERIAKKQIVPSAASRRPVRKRTRPKNEDFEYDLSNLLKMEAQGYRDSRETVTCVKSNQTKKKSIQDQTINYESLNKECSGALATLSKNSVERNLAHMKITNLAAFPSTKEFRTSNIFVRPMIPRVSRGDKVSPRKDANEETKDNSSPSKFSKTADSLPVIKNVKLTNLDDNPKEAAKDTSFTKAGSDSSEPAGDKASSSNKKDKPNLKIPAVVPIKFRRQSLDVINNPIINKNITDFTKAGMKTKILVIKPINRNREGSQSLNAPLKFQTIKLKDPNKNRSSSKDISSDQVVVVKVPKVERTSEQIKETDITKETVDRPICNNNTNECLTSNIKENVKQNINLSESISDNHENADKLIDSSEEKDSVLVRDIKSEEKSSINDSVTIKNVVCKEEHQESTTTELRPANNEDCHIMSKTIKSEAIET